MTYEPQGNFPAAQKLRRQVLATLTRLHGKDHWAVTDPRLALQDVELLVRLEAAERSRLAQAWQLNERAVQLHEQGKTREAVPLAQKALEINRQVLGERHPHYATYLNHLAALRVPWPLPSKAPPVSSSNS
jgi:hypothetical protein